MRLLAGEWTSEHAKRLDTVELVTAESQHSMLKKVGWGAAGSLAFGGVGLLAGVLAGGNRTTIAAILRTTDGEQALFEMTPDELKRLTADAINARTERQKKAVEAQKPRLRTSVAELDQMVRRAAARQIAALQDQVRAGTLPRAEYEMQLAAIEVRLQRNKEGGRSDLLRKTFSGSLLLAVGVFLAVKACGIVSGENGSSEQLPVADQSSVVSPKVNLISLSSNEQARVCKAAIATLFGRDPTKMQGRQIEANIQHVSYRRPSDGKRWQSRCWFDGSDRIIWAPFNAFGNDGLGRWRYEDDVRFTISKKSVTIIVKDGGVLTSEETFPLSLIPS